VLVLLIVTEPVFEEASDRRHTLEGADAWKRCVPDSIWSVNAHNCLELTALGSFRRLPPTLDQVGGRGLVRHCPLSIPECCFRRRASVWRAWPCGYRYGRLGGVVFRTH